MLDNLPIELIQLVYHNICPVKVVKMSPLLPHHVWLANRYQESVNLIEKKYKIYYKNKIRDMWQRYNENRYINIHRWHIECYSDNKSNIFPIPNKRKIELVKIDEFM